MYNYNSQHIVHKPDYGTENQNCYSIDQLDGNASCDSSSVLSEPYCPCCDDVSDSGTSTSFDQDYDQGGHAIPVLGTLPQYNGVYIDPPAWYDEYKSRIINKGQSKMNRITIRRDNRLEVGESLPIIAVSNMRSLTPKLYNFKNDMIEREISVALLSEVWEKANCKKQQYEIEKMLQLEGLKYISTPRTTKRGGGAAIVVNLSKFSLEKIQVVIPLKLEVVWGLMRPKKVTR